MKSCFCLVKRLMYTHTHTLLGHILVIEVYCPEDIQKKLTHVGTLENKPLALQEVFPWGQCLCYSIQAIFMRTVKYQAHLSDSYMIRHTFQKLSNKIVRAFIREVIKVSFFKRKSLLYKASSHRNQFLVCYVFFQIFRETCLQPEFQILTREIQQGKRY